MGNKTGDKPIRKHNEFSEHGNSKTYNGERFEVTERDSRVETSSRYEKSFRRTVSQYFGNQDRMKVTSRSANSLFLLLRILVDCGMLIKQWILVYLLISYASAYREQKFAIEPQDQVIFYFSTSPFIR